MPIQSWMESLLIICAIVFSTLILAQVQYVTDKNYRTSDSNTASLPIHERIFFFLIFFTCAVLLFSDRNHSDLPVWLITPWFVIVGALSVNDIRTLCFPGNIWYGISITCIGIITTINNGIISAFQMGLAWALAMLYAFIIFILGDARVVVGGGDLKIWPLLACVLPSPVSLAALLLVYAGLSFITDKFLDIAYVIWKREKRPAKSVYPGLPVLLLSTIIVIGRFGPFLS